MRRHRRPSQRSVDRPHVQISAFLCDRQHGPTGVGKELAAQAIRLMSARARGPWVVANAAAFAAGLIDAELFGNRAAITDGKMPASTGLVEEAQGGFLFLDEIGDMPRDLQHRLLRALEGSYRRLGETIDRVCNFRCIGATNRSYSALEGDVYGRLKLVVSVPVLNDRREDLPALIRRHVLAAAKASPHLVGRFLRKGLRGRDEIAIEPELVTALLRHNYTYNVRELDSLLERAFVESPEDTIVVPEVLLAQMPKPSESDMLRMEAEGAMRRHRNNKSAAARELGISRWTLDRRLSV